MKEKGLVDTSVISGFIDNSDLEKKVAKLSAKEELKNKQDKTVKLEASDSRYFHGKSHFEDNGKRSY